MISTIIRCSDLVICMVRLVISGIRNSNLSDQFVTSVKCRAGPAVLKYIVSLII